MSTLPALLVRNETAPVPSDECPLHQRFNRGDTASLGQALEHRLSRLDLLSLKQRKALYDLPTLSAAITAAIPWLHGTRAYLVAPTLIEFNVDVPHARHEALLIHDEHGPRDPEEYEAGRVGSIRVSLAEDAKWARVAAPAGYSMPRRLVLRVSRNRWGRKPVRRARARAFYYALITARVEAATVPDLLATSRLSHGRRSLALDAWWDARLASGYDHDTAATMLALVLPASVQLSYNPQTGRPYLLVNAAGT